MNKIKYTHPKVLSIDCEEETSELEKAGFNVEHGSFGKPYNVSVSSQYEPVKRSDNLPKDLREKEIIIIDTRGLHSGSGDGLEKEFPDDELDWWAKCSNGYIDPKSRAMAIHSSTFKDIYVNGGIFIVFGSPRDLQDLIFAKNSYGSLEINNKINYDNWGFLPLFSKKNFNINYAFGTEIFPEDDFSENSILRKYLVDSTYSITIEPTYMIEENEYRSFANDKFGKSVSGVYHEPGSTKGHIFIFPEMKNKSGFLFEFISKILPEISPEVFDSNKGKSWKYSSDYENHTIVKLKDELTVLETNYLENIAKIKDSIAQERQEYKFLRDLITETGDTLVSAVHETLEHLGFKDVVDTDKELESTGETSVRHEDLQIKDSSPLLLVEVKGITGLPSDEDALAANKYVAVRMRSLGRTDINSLAIINHQRKIECLNRENENVFRKEILLNAEAHNLGLLTTWDLFRIYKSFQINDWSHEYIKGSFYKSGRISAIPQDYKFLGKVVKNWKKSNSFGLKCEIEGLEVGGKISIECNNCVREAYVKSIQVNGENVNQASLGQEVGIEISDNYSHIKVNQRVYLVK
ncbi:hypothetical protein DAY19_03125 [Halobacteriovorax vibrionivorans]|uniref:Uncharacterized protein n=1 Tax=Halobacteriovorax vibrionivorans TaxID=2152716 RepID=A0ABY0IIJ7_9BACT|nr:MULTISPECIES: hypothetical protein [Halobacteriovorax]RZF22781.1 hypothetical protein DAY19_03125 [Halobacteriovorax vibrionivorans]TGD45972.1 hypothetical protein EP118_13815 [Halobacteriovorax sp. Y22]